MKIVIIGTNHAGIAVANTLLASPQKHEVVMLDRNSNLSYLGCGTALWVGRQIDSNQGLFYTNKEEFQKKGARISLETEVTHIDYQAKKVYAKTKDGQELEESYDKLVLATGSLPIQLPIPGSDLEGIHFLKLFQEGEAVDQEFAKDSVKTVAVIGAGYIGTELAEAAIRRGKKVLLFDGQDHSLPGYYDPDFSAQMDQNLEELGIELHFKELATEFVGNDQGRVCELVTDKGRYQVDTIISAVGFIPNIQLAQDHLELGPSHAIHVDRHQQTSDPDVYAVGDCATIYSNALQAETYIALASNAVRSGLVAGYNIDGCVIEANGVQGSNGISINGLNFVSTGLTQQAAKDAGFEIEFVDFQDTQFPGFMPENEEVKIRIIYDKKSHRILGAQLASRYDISANIHLFSLAIQEQVTIDRLAFTDLFFLPHFNQPYNYITQAALKSFDKE